MDTDQPPLPPHVEERAWKACTALMAVYNGTEVRRIKLETWKGTDIWCNFLSKELWLVDSWETPQKVGVDP